MSLPGDNRTLSNKKSTVEEFNEGKEKEETMKIWDCRSPLYDSYELVAISHLIERKFMKFPYQNESLNSDDQSSHDSSRIDKIAASVKLKNIADGERREKKKWSIIAKICSRIMSWKKLKCITNH
ncbi:hypothetical protein RND71_001062 [Anisodus tanguticus]|uniref:Uncharacterized protein n=1 Tax=Anisodus tanguticus TaxID=243964 RepID=A0AAE1SZJ7_9SOLA|nr:hypothetical protein RND71_001062 [Anisodus tanguticus]